MQSALISAETIIFLSFSSFSRLRGSVYRERAWERLEARDSPKEIDEFNI